MPAVNVDHGRVAVFAERDPLRQQRRRETVKVKTVGAELADGRRVETGEEAVRESHAFNQVEPQDLHRLRHADHRPFEAEEGRIGDLQELGRQAGVLRDERADGAGCGVGLGQFLHHPEVDRGRAGQLLDARHHPPQVLVGEEHIEFHQPRQGPAQLVGLTGFREILVGGAEGSEHLLIIKGVGEDDPRGAGMPHHDGAQQVNAAQTRRAGPGHHRIELPRFQSGERLGAVTSRHHLPSRVMLTTRGRQQGGPGVVGIDEQNPFGRHRHASLSAVCRPSLSWECRQTTRVAPDQSRKVRSRSALVTTQIELRLIATPASIGLSNQPQMGYRAPAAMGMPRPL